MRGKCFVSVFSVEMLCHTEASGDDGKDKRLKMSGLPVLYPLTAQDTITNKVAYVLEASPSVKHDLRSNEG